MKNNKYLTLGLTIVAAIGVVATSVTAVRATPKAVKKLEENGIDTDDILKFVKDEPVKVVKNVAPVYAPSIAIGAATIVCIFGANRLSVKQQATIAGAYAMLAKSMKDYEAKAKEIFGEDADEKIKDAVVEDTLHNKYIYAPEGTLLFYDNYSDEYFERTMLEVQNAEYELNKRFIHEGYVTLNDFYYLLGLPETELGKKIGWSTDAGIAFYGYVWIDFEHQLVTMDDGLECYILNFPANPTEDYRDY